MQVPITFSPIRKANYPNKTNITANLNSGSFGNRVLDIVNHEGEKLVEGRQFQRFSSIFVFLLTKITKLDVFFNCVGA